MIKLPYNQTLTNGLILTREEGKMFPFWAMYLWNEMTLEHCWMWMHMHYFEGNTMLIENFNDFQEIWVTQWGVWI